MYNNIIKKAHINKDINNYFYKKLKKLSNVNNFDFFMIALNEAIKFSDLGVDNDFKYNTIKHANINNKLIKVSYPNNSEKNIYKEYSEKRWSSAYNQLQNYIHNGASSDKAYKYIKYYNNFDNDEIEKFKKWSEFHLKYSNLEGQMKKKGTHDKGINSGGIYGGQIYDLPGSSFSPRDYMIERAKGYKEKFKERNADELEQELSGDLPPEPKKQTKSDKRKAIRSLKRNIVSMQKIILNNDDIDFETYSDATKYLFELSNIIKKIKSEKLVVDATFRAVGQLNKIGLKKEGEQLRKFAQAAESQLEEELPREPPPFEEREAPLPDDTLAEEPRINQEMEAEEPGPPGGQRNRDINIPKTEDVKPEAYENIRTPGPAEGEYDKIIGQNITIADASKKLDDVASMLADRRIIRFLAEFDIMLDKLGIASMFPELAESQSKLIDSFSYALTRVTKMMGQLSNAQSLANKTKTIPGVEETAELEEEGLEPERRLEPEEEQEIEG